MDSMTPATVLIVDDEVDNLKLLNAFLQDAGFRVAIARGGREALQRVEQIVPQLILLDVKMPEMDGFEVCATLKAMPAAREIPVIFLTGYADTDGIVKAFHVGAVDYVTKPFRKEELLARVKTHLTLQNTTNALRELNAAKDRFFSIISHDLRSPFTGFISFIEAMLDNLANYSIDDIIIQLTRQRETAKTLYSLLENLLMWSSLQQGRVSYAPQIILLNTVIDHSIAVFQSNLEQKHIHLTTTVPKDTTAFADYRMIETVMRNLLSNAIKFTPSGGAIAIIIRENHALSAIDVTVTDSGIGMNQDELAKLFRIDLKYSRHGTDGEKGTGLGLILCKELLEKNNGRLWVQSEPGKGSTFGFTIPKDEKYVGG